MTEPHEIERTREAYDRRQIELAALHAQIETVIGQERHYGIRVWREENPADRPEGQWFLTDPFRDRDRYAFAHYANTPPAVNVYTREQYERACAAVGLTPAEDAALGSYADKFMPPNLWDLYPLQHVEAQLRRRRMAGVERETAPQRAAAAAAAEQRWAEERAARQAEAEAADRRCDECGTLIERGTGMVASLGLACDEDCYTAMSDRPGRYATRVARSTSRR